MTVKVDSGDWGAKTADDDLVGLAEALREARSAIKAWREREDDLKSQIIEAMGGAELAVRDRKGVCRIVTQVQQRFNSNGFAADYPDLYEAYRRPIDIVKVEV